ncbi:unnamed protein product [Bemisia tabaci]|uniref:Uncharacterized protein n=1 Tax=Bemisia tabaci TaxID=7038 RepID=A0A9P0F714_BEMTA|nr:unnamed protein product [Bemisia tabaci]
MITEAQFVLVCRYLLKSRIDHVYSNVSGRRVDGRIVMPKEVYMPKALSDLINGVGFITAQGGCLKLCPKPEPNPQEAAQRLGTLVTYENLENFSLLIEACTYRNLIQSGLLSSVTLGTAWWMLSAGKIDDPSTVADGDEEDVKILSCLKEFTPADAVYCALAQRQNTGIEEGIDIGMKYTGDDIFGIPSLRSIYNVRA